MNSSKRHWSVQTKLDKPSLIFQAFPVLLSNRDHVLSTYQRPFWDLYASSSSRVFCNVNWPWLDVPKFILHASILWHSYHRKLVMFRRRNLGLMMLRKFYGGISCCRRLAWLTSTYIYSAIRGLFAASCLILGWVIRPYRDCGDIHSSHGPTVAFLDRLAMLSSL